MAMAMPVTNRFVVQSTSVFLLVGFLALLAIVGMTFWLGERSQVYFNDVIEARDTRASAVELRNAVQTAESSQRGFLFTGNEIYLAPYGTAKALALRQMQTLKQVLQPYRQSDIMVERLSTIVAEKFSEMDRTIALKRERKDAEVAAIVRTNRGKALMDEANVFFSGIIRSTDQRLTTGVGEQKANAGWLRSFSIFGALIIVAVVGGAAVSIVLYTRQLREARDEVSILNAELEGRVEARTADLARANQEIQRFAYIVTHDLRAPLVNIMGFTSEVEGGIRSMQALIDKAQIGDDPTDPVAKEARVAVSEELPEAIGFIRSSTRKMDSLISAILKLSREGRRSLRPETLELAEVVGASVAAIQHQISEAGGEVTLDIDVPPLVSDRLSLEQTFGNLLDNAVKYRFRQRPLRIGVEAAPVPGDRLSISVADNGRGIAEQDRERIFDLFSRAGAQDQPGEGIGLAYVRTVVRNLGGEISVSSVPDEGTVFHILLPRTLPAALASAT